MMAQAAVQWWSRLQAAVSLSTCEAELMALIEMVKEIIYLKPILEALKIKKRGEPMVVEQDNQSTIALASSFQLTRRNKHFSIKRHFITEMIESGDLVLRYCNTLEMLADAFTKTFGAKQFTDFCFSIGLRTPPQWVELPESTTKILPVGDLAQAVARRHYVLLSTAHN